MSYFCDQIIEYKKRKYKKIVRLVKSKSTVADQ